MCGVCRLLVTQDPVFEGLRLRGLVGSWGLGFRDLGLRGFRVVGLRVKDCFQGPCEGSFVLRH